MGRATCRPDPRPRISSVPGPCERATWRQPALPRPLLQLWRLARSVRPDCAGRFFFAIAAAASPGQACPPRSGWGHRTNPARRGAAGAAGMPLGRPFLRACPSSGSAARGACDAHGPGPAALGLPRRLCAAWSRFRLARRCASSRRGGGPRFLTATTGTTGGKSSEVPSWDLPFAQGHAPPRWSPYPLAAALVLLVVGRVPASIPALSSPPRFPRVSLRPWCPALSWALARAARQP